MKAHTNLPDFLVLLLLPPLPLLLQLDSLLLVFQPLIFVQREMNFSVASLEMWSFPCLILIRAVHMALIIRLRHVHAKEDLVTAALRHVEK